MFGASCSASLRLFYKSDAPNSFFVTESRFFFVLRFPALARRIAGGAPTGQRANGPTGQPANGPTRRGQARNRLSGAMDRAFVCSNILCLEHHVLHPYDFFTIPKPTDFFLRSGAPAPQDRKHFPGARSTTKMVRCLNIILVSRLLAPMLVASVVPPEASRNRFQTCEDTHRHATWGIGFREENPNTEVEQV